ncbi:MAG: hypothetical protein GY795_41020, partial [Desulfobacterales bacterium]|nr:hypothetical protein [Desulfobacterales bacterium]
MLHNPAKVVKSEQSNIGVVGDNVNIEGGLHFHQRSYFKPLIVVCTIAAVSIFLTIILFRSFPIETKKLTYQQIIFTILIASIVCIAFILILTKVYKTISIKIFIIMIIPLYMTFSVVSACYLLDKSFFEIIKNIVSLNNNVEDNKKLESVEDNEKLESV